MVTAEESNGIMIDMREDKEEEEENKEILEWI
jgi:hypothetical protein